MHPQTLIKEFVDRNKIIGQLPVENGTVSIPIRRIVNSHL